MKMRYIMRGFTSVVRLPLFLIVVFTISAAAQEQPENNQFNGLDYTLQKPAKNERYAKKKFGDHSHGIVQIAVKSPLDIKIPAARSRWNAQNAMQ